jgi:hypothetical protein
MSFRETAFLSKSNINLLWSVLNEHDFMTNRNPNDLTQIQNIFSSNLQNFYNSNKNMSLMDLNKNYIASMVKFISPYMKTVPAPVSTEKPLYTHEDIQNNRLSAFEKDLKSKQNEFQNSMNKPVPPTPNFADDTDGPISNLEVEMKKYMTQRNYDVQNLPPQSDPSWLKPVETSVKTEKINYSTSNPKMIKIDNHILNESIQAIDLDKPKKNISWSDNLTQDDEPESFSELSIFSKLKTVPTPEEDLKQELQTLKEEVKTLHEKLDLILEFFQNKK